MAFRFALESVLKHRQRLEDEAQREFTAAEAALADVLAFIKGMYQRVEDVRAEISAAETGTRRDKLELIRGAQEFLIGFGKQIELKRLEARELMRVAEEKHELLVEAAREKKILAKLKDKRRIEYRAHRERLETKELDDLAVMRRSRK